MRIYFMGVCGTAMGQAALLLRSAGHEVLGADAGVYPPMSTVLAGAGARRSAKAGAVLRARGFRFGHARRGVGGTGEQDGRRRHQVSVKKPSGSDFVCPNCGADVPGGSASCPECGSDDRTGWSEDTRYDGLDLPDEAFEDEAAPDGGFRQLLPQTEDLPARHQGRQPPQFVERPLQRGGVGVLRLLQDGPLAPGIRRPFRNHEFSS